MIKVLRQLSTVASLAASLPFEKTPMQDNSLDSSFDNLVHEDKLPNKTFLRIFNKFKIQIKKVLKTYKRILCKQKIRNTRNAGAGQYPYENVCAILDHVLLVMILISNPIILFHFITYFFYLLPLPKLSLLSILSDIFGLLINHFALDMMNTFVLIFQLAHRKFMTFIIMLFLQHHCTKYHILGRIGYKVDRLKT